MEAEAWYGESRRRVPAAASMSQVAQAIFGAVWRPGYAALEWRHGRQRKRNGYLPERIGAGRR